MYVYKCLCMFLILCTRYVFKWIQINENSLKNKILAYKMSPPTGAIDFNNTVPLNLEFVVL